MSPTRPEPQPQEAQPEPERSWVRPAADAGAPTGPAADERPPLFAASPRRAPQAPPSSESERPATFGPRRPQPAALDPVASIRLAEPLERLDPGSVRDALPALVPLARTLDPDEQVLAMVQGWAKGLLGVVARTERRLVVVVDRFPEPLIESLDPVATRVHLFGPPGTDRLSVAIVDGNRLLELSGVRDAGEAEQLAAVPQPSESEHAPEYF